jgi:hypothetical protein
LLNICLCSSAKDIHLSPDNHWYTLISVHGSKNTITNIKPDCEITIFQEINIGRKREKFLLHQDYSNILNIFILLFINRPHFYSRDQKSTVYQWLSGLRCIYFADEHRHILSNEEYTLVNRNQSLTMFLVWREHVFWGTWKRHHPTPQDKLSFPKTCSIIDREWDYSKICSFIIVITKYILWSPLNVKWQFRRYLGSANFTWLVNY